MPLELIPDHDARFEEPESAESPYCYACGSDIETDATTLIGHHVYHCDYECAGIAAATLLSRKLTPDAEKADARAVLRELLTVDQLRDDLRTEQP